MSTLILSTSAGISNNHLADSEVITADQAIGHQLRTLEAASRQQVAEAARAASGTNGTRLCHDGKGNGCGKEIPLTRLKVIPEALLCTECQTGVEKKTRLMETVKPSKHH